MGKEKVIISLGNKFSENFGQKQRYLFIYLSPQKIY